MACITTIKVSPVTQSDCCVYTHLKVIYLLCILEKWKAGSLEHTLRYTPQEKLDWLVSSPELNEVAKRLPNWQLLAPHLHITKEEEEIISNYPSELQSLKCLQKWSRKQGRMATYRTLVNAIQNMGSKDFYNCICKLLSIPSSPPSQDHIQIQHYVEILRLGYSRLIPPNIFESFIDENDESGPSPSEQYINLMMTTRERVQRGGVDEEHLSLALHGNTQGMADYMEKKGQKVPVDVKDIFTINSKQNKIILIEGAPGSGKTALSRHIVKTWAIGEQFQQFSLILLIQLRDRVVQEAQGLADLLPFECNLAERKAITECIEQKDGGGILLLFDGWDELPEEKKQIFLDILKHPGKYRLSKATVLITSRPIVSTVIQNIARCTRIEILGFTSEQIEGCIKESLPKKEAYKLIFAIRLDPALEENCYLPLSLAIITHTYITLNHKLPETFCRIIIELGLSCLYRHMLKHHIRKWTWHYIKKKTYYYIKKCIHPRSTQEDMHKILTSFNDLEGEMKTKFESLCKIAHDSMLEQRYSFSNPNMPTLGLMQSVQSFAVRGRSTEHYFLHLSLHELCAAWHLVTLPPSEQERILPEYLMKRPMENVLGFFSALGGWKTQENKELLFGHTFDSKTLKQSSNVSNVTAVYAEPRSLTHLHYFHEAQSAELCESLFSMIHINFSKTSGHTSRDIAAVRYIIYDKKLESLALSFISDEHLKVLKDDLRENMPNELCIGNGCLLGHEGWKIIAELMQQTMMKAISCSITEITSADIDCLRTALQHCQLMSFVMSSINIGDTGLAQFAKYLENTELTCLGFECCEIGDEGIASLSAVLPNTKLNTLSIGGNNITSRGLTVLANAIMNTPNFRRIKFHRSKANKMTPGRDVQGFLERLLHHPRFSDIVINVHTTNETFREYFDDFNGRRIELGLQMVNMDTSDSVVPDNVNERCWVNHYY